MFEVRKKRGQVTIFIVIGLILLLGIGIFYYIRTQIIEAEAGIALKQDEAEGVALVVQNYVSTCLDETTKQAILLIGQQGGYINLSRTDLHSRSFTIDETDATSSDTAPFGALQIPYWWYEDTTHGCTRCSITTKNIPTLETMETQMAAYITDKFQQCLNNFESLEQYKITETEAPVITASIGDKAVYAQLNYPITWTSGDASGSLENWYVEEDVPLKEIYDAAAEIVSMEIKNQFFEQILLNIISAYSGLDEERLPPIAAFTEGYSVIYWIKQNVKEQLGQYLGTYFPLIQIKGTAGVVELTPDNKYGTGFFAMLTRESDYPFGDLKVNFLSPVDEATDYYMEITPKVGELLKPSSYKNEFPLNILPPIQTNHYSFFYDVSYPVVVALRDEQAFSGEGYTFLIAMEANIRDNKNLMEWAKGDGTFGPWDSSKVEIKLKEGVPTTYPSGIDTETNETVYSTAEVPEKTLICDPAQRLSGTIEVSAYNGISGDPINGASVAYRCGTYSTCLMGATNVAGDYKSTFPVCVGGAVRIDATGYYTAYSSIDTLPEQDGKIIVLLEPIKSVPVEIKFIPSARLNQSMSAAALRNLAFDMSRTDSVLVTLEKVPDQLFETPYSQVVTVTKDEPVNLSLVSGIYTVNALLLDQAGIIIPARNETYGNETVEYPEVNMTPAMLGQISLDTTTGQWEVASEDLQSAKGVTFYVFRMDNPIYIEDLGELGEFTNYTTVFREVVEPEWEK